MNQKEIETEERIPQIRKKEIMKAIRGIKNKKALDRDEIHGEILKLIEKE